MPVKQIGGSRGTAYTKPTGTNGAISGRKPTSPVPASAAIVLPTKLSEPVKSLGECLILIHGEKKIGKTSLCARFPGAFFFMFEPGSRGLRILREFMPTWLRFKQYVKAVQAKPGLYQTLIIDTVDKAYERCLEYVCEREGCEHPQDNNDFGATWKKVKKEFETEMNKLAATGAGMVFISHSKVREFQSRGGEKYDKLVASMGNQAREMMSGEADIIAYYGYYGTRRYLTIAGSEALDAGHRLEENFRTVSGERVHSIPMGDSAQEGYDNIVKAFNNQQKLTGEPRGSVGLSDVPVRKPSRNAR